MLAREVGPTIRQCAPSDSAAVFAVINDAAASYRDIIPADCWRDPYMSMEELTLELDDGVVFWGLETDGRLVGVMGIQDRGDVQLIRHAYVATRARRQGIGTRLLRHLESLSDKPLLVGTWADASWAIAFYQKNGYRLVKTTDKDRLLDNYWRIPRRQIETSVVLADARWRHLRSDD